MKVETLDSPLCPLCNKFHMALEQPQIKEVFLLNGIELEYPIQDDTWASRRWRKDKRDYIDLSNGQDLSCTLEICPDCYDKRVKSNDVNVDGHVICSKKGCANDCNEFSKYCNEHYDEAYQFSNVNFNSGMTRKMVHDIKGGSIPYPHFVLDDKYNISYAMEVVSISGMASNNGNPDALTIYKKYPDGSTEKFDYELKRTISKEELSEINKKNIRDNRNFYLLIILFMILSFGLGCFLTSHFNF